MADMVNFTLPPSMPQEAPTVEPQNRRDFGKALLAAPLTVALIGEATAQTPPKPSEEIAKNLAEIVRVRFGSRLKEGDLAKIQQRIQNNLFTNQLLNSVPLDNSDEPDFVFEATEA